MNRNLLIALFIVVALAAAASAAYWLWPRPAAFVSGDAWDYRLLPEDLPAGWMFAGQAPLTAHDLAEPDDAGQPVLTPTASLKDVRQLYTLRYAPPATSEYFDFTLQVLIYRSVADAQAGLGAENPGQAWEKVDAPAVGEGSQVWRYRDPEAGLDQNLYRVDFRYLNAVGSVTMFGTARALPGPDEPVRYAQMVLAKMQAGAEPPALRRLEAAGAPDLRGLLLTQAQLAEIDQAFGERWGLSDEYLAAWTDNADFSPEARSVLDRLGRIAGYQMYLVKPVAADEQGLVSSAALFQQVSAYRRAESTPDGLRAMIGLEGAQEAPDPPPVGEGARAWSGLLKTRDSDETLAVSEISFRVGRYVATVQLQSPPLDEGPAQQAMRQTNLALAIRFAEALAENLRAAGR